MTTRHPLSLSQTQLEIVLKAGARCPVEWRSRMLMSVADRLIVLDEVSDDAVRTACAATLRRIIPVGDAA